MYRNISGLELNRSNRWYKWTYQSHVTKDEAMNLQKKAGFHPAGYGFYSYKQETSPQGTEVTTWECANNCH